MYPLKRFGKHSSGFDNLGSIILPLNTFHKYLANATKTRLEMFVCITNKKGDVLLPTM